MDKDIDKLVKYKNRKLSFGSLSRGNTALLVFMSNDGEFYLGPQSCNIGLLRNAFGTDKTKYILGGIQHLDSKEIKDEHKVYLDFLINRSIFAPAFISKNVDWCFHKDNMCVIVDPNAPRVMVGGAMNHLRRLWEFSWIPLMFTKYTSLGMSEDMALLIATASYTDSNGKNIQIKAIRAEHENFTLDQMYSDSVKRYLTRDVDFKESYNVNKEFRGYSKNVWNNYREPSGVGVNFIQFLRENIKADTTDSGYKNPFIKAKAAYRTTDECFDFNSLDVRHIEQQVAEYAGLGEVQANNSMAG